MSLVLSPGLALTSIIFKPLNSLFFKIKSMLLIPLRQKDVHIFL